MRGGESWIEFRVTGSHLDRNSCDFPGVNFDGSTVTGDIMQEFELNLSKFCLAVVRKKESLVDVLFGRPSTRLLPHHNRQTLFL
jgi:hypothetical protein